MQRDGLLQPPGFLVGGREIIAGGQVEPNDQQDPRLGHGRAVPVTCPIRPWHAGASGSLTGAPTSCLTGAIAVKAAPEKYS